MPIFKVEEQIKAKLIDYASIVTCQPLDHSKCNKICYTASYNKQTRESTNFQTKIPYLLLQIEN